LISSISRAERFASMSLRIDRCEAIALPLYLRRPARQAGESPRLNGSIQCAGPSMCSMMDRLRATLEEKDMPLLKLRH
jgi:hypothetical protein